ncbi:MAG: hypothetical protein LBD72_02505, partial [Puniceicoccales bacterium]|nr:hypothetical protein [Puniceicoccales bacterium]
MPVYGVYDTEAANYNDSYSGWQIGRFPSANNAGPKIQINLEGTGQQMANSFYAVAFGAGYAGTGKDFSGWTFGAFGDNANITVANGSSDSALYHTSVFGAGAGARYYDEGNSQGSGAGPSFDNWQFGNFGANVQICATSAHHATIFGMGYGCGNFAGWEIESFGAGSILTSKFTPGHSSPSFTALFGAGQLVGDATNFSNWTIGDFGVESRLTANDFNYAAIFGVGCVSKNACVNFSNWTIGNFGNGSELTANDCQDAAIFGAASTSGTSNFSNWTIGDFGAGSKLTANNCDYAAIFGAGYGYIGSTSNFSNWTIGNFGAGSELTVNNCNKCAAIFGAGSTGGSTSTSNFSNWTIGNFGAGSEPTVNNCNYYAAIFGAGHIYSKYARDFSNWTIGNFGAKSKLTTNDCKYVAIFGAASTSSASNFSNWTIGNFGAGSKLTVNARNYAAIFGAGYTNASANFSGWRIGNFGDSIKLCNHGKYSSYRAVFGAGSASGKSNFSNWSIGSFGANAELIVQRGSSATVFGAGYASGTSNFSNWTIGAFADGAKLIDCSTARFTADHALFGLAGIHSTAGATFKNWTVEFCGNAILGLLANIDDGTSPIYISLNALGGIKNSDFRFYFNNAKTEDVIVTIGALKSQMPEDGRLAKKEEEVGGGRFTWVPAEIAAFQLAGTQGWGTNIEQPYATAIALGPNFQLNVGRARTLEEQPDDTNA